MKDPRRSLPSVDALMASEAFAALVEAYGRERAVEAARHAVARVRADIGSGRGPPALEAPSTYAAIATGVLEAADVPSLRRVINATGVVLHTNLGRAPIAAAAAEAMAAAASAYSNLEYDLGGGARGSRYDHCVALLRELTGAADAVVVNNNAAALILALNTVARGRGVAVSRGELVEIGGGFRVPEILERSGARLVEVGSTNRTRLADYEAALDGGAAAILKVHRSNFRITGFTEDVGVDELAGLARARNAPLMHDLGSGLFIDAGLLGLPDEPRAAESLAGGASLVAVSGDKLLGGPQAGIILGDTDHVAALRKNPMCRALRVDKVTLAGLEATLRLYRDPARARAEIPTLRMLSATPAELTARADAMVQGLASRRVAATVVPGEGAVGGGTYPGVRLHGPTVAIGGVGADRLAARLREGVPPVVARIVSDRVVLDPRTVLPGEDDELVRAVADACAEVSATP